MSPARRIVARRVAQSRDLSSSFVRAWQSPERQSPDWRFKTPQTLSSSLGGRSFSSDIQATPKPKTPQTLSSPGLSAPILRFARHSPPASFPPCHPEWSGPTFSFASTCGASGRAVEGSLLPPARHSPRRPSVIPSGAARSFLSRRLVARRVAQSRDLSCLLLATRRSLITLSNLCFDMDAPEGAFLLGGRGFSPGVKPPQNKNIPDSFSPARADLCRVYTAHYTSLVTNCE